VAPVGGGLYFSIPMLGCGGYYGSDLLKDVGLNVTEITVAVR